MVLKCSLHHYRPSTNYRTYTNNYINDRSFTNNDYEYVDGSYESGYPKAPFALEGIINSASNTYDDTLII